MKRIVLLLLFTSMLFLPACAKVGLKDPVTIPGLGEELSQPVKNLTVPKFENGDIVRYKMLGDKQGIIMNSNYKYLPQLETWYCIVDFYPSSAAIHLDFSQFDNYERRYVYEFELELIRKYSKDSQRRRIRRRWYW